MKKLFRFFFMLILLPAVSSAQSSQFKGGFGHFMIGPGWFEPSELKEYLQRPGVLGPSLDYYNTGVVFGGEGMAEIRGFLLGGGFYGAALPSMSSDSATAWVGTSGGYFKSGYAFFQNGRQMAMLNCGFGGGATIVNIKNNRLENRVHFDPREPIPPGDERAYTLGHVLFDLALSYKAVASSQSAEERGRYSGFMFGIDLGTVLGLRMDEWRYDGNATGPVPAPDQFVNPYIRITIGGGGFRKSSNE